MSIIIRPFSTHHAALSPTSSSKENHQTFAALLSPPAASSSLSGATPKSSTRIRLSGFGRSPAQKANRQAHNAKPYARIGSTSISRAKAATSSPAKPRPVPLKLVPLEVGAANLQKPVKIPTQLPRPVIPPVGPCVEGIPADYFFNKLRPLLRGLQVISSSYDLAPGAAPPTLALADFEPPRVYSRERTVAFAMPKTAHTNDLEDKIAGRKPNVCLAVWGRDRKGPARLIPANEVVYASQCSFWPRLTSAPTNNVEDEDQALETIEEASEGDESFELEGTEVDGDSSFTSTSSSSTDSVTLKLSTTFDAALSASAIAPADNTLHLPLVSLTLPSPETFSVLHHHLHNPSTPFAPLILDMPPNIVSRDQAVAELSELSVPELMTKLERIHAVWKNVCALGIPSDRTWCGMAEAWGCVVGVLARQAPRSGDKSA